MPTVNHSINQKDKLRVIIRYQIWHILTFAVLCWLAYTWQHTSVSASIGDFWGIPTRTWFWLAVWTPFIHQLYVWLIWRIELYTRAFSSYWGEQRAFRIYQVPFMLMLVARLVTVALLAFSNRQVMRANTTLTTGAAIVLSVPVLWTLYSVMRYFGLDRACGIDHFVRNYNEPFERRGIYRYMNNAMYVFGLAVLYLPGLLLRSPAALIVALINHVLIWAHYFCTELPDMRVIYGIKPDVEG